MPNYNSIPAMPPLPTRADTARAEFTSLRRRLLEGTWEQDLENELYRHLPSDRRDAWGAADLSSNPFEQVTRQLSVLYHETPHIHADGDSDISALTGRAGILTKSGLWPLMQRVQQLTLGLRECFLRIDVAPHSKQATARVPGITYRVVTPDFVYCEASPDNPDEPLYYQETRLRENPEGELVWVADVLDIRDLKNPFYGMKLINTDGSLGADVSSDYMGHPSHVGEGYPFRNAEGVPFLPLTMYRAAKTGKLWNAFDNSSLVFGSLTSAVLFTMWTHIVKDASWPQRYIAGLQLAGLDTLEQNTIARRASVTTDPSSILVFMQDQDNTSQPLVGQFQPGASPKELLEAVASYEYRVAVSGGISPSELIRSSSDPRSGFSLSVSRQGQREASRAYAPLFRHSDEDLLAKTAALSNRYLGTSLPESGYYISYQALPLSPDEMKALREDIVQKLAASLISPLEAIRMLHPDLDEEAARQKLLKIRRERAEFL